MEVPKTAQSKSLSELYQTAPAWVRFVVVVLCIIGGMYVFTAVLSWLAATSDSLSRFLDENFRYFTEFVWLPASPITRFMIGGIIFVCVASVVIILNQLDRGGNKKE